MAPLPDELPCPRCGTQAKVVRDEAGRYRLYCVTCGYDDYLKVAMKKPICQRH